MLDELLEALEVVLDTSRRCLHHLIANLAGCALRRVVVDGELYFGVPIDGFELHLTRVLIAGDRTPGDDPIGLLLDDLGFPFALGTGNPGFPFQVLVVELANFLDGRATPR